MSFNDIKNEIEDRVASPLRGAYLITCLFFNWRLIVIGFDSDLSAAIKIEQIEAKLNAYGYPLIKAFTDVLLIPVAIALALNFVFAWLEYYPLKYRIFLSKKIEEYKRHETEVALLTKELLLELNRMISAADAVSKEYIHDKNRKLGDFTAHFDELHSAQKSALSLKNRIKTKNKFS